MPLQQYTYQALLAASAQTTLVSPAGSGIAVCGPTGIGNNWTPTQVGVSVTSSHSTPIAYLYIGPFLPAGAMTTLLGTQQVTQIAGTNTGNNDSIGLQGILVPQGQALVVQWTGGDVGAQAIMTVVGYQTATYWR